MGRSGASQPRGIARGGPFCASRARWAVRAWLRGGRAQHGWCSSPRLPCVCDSLPTAVHAGVTTDAAADNPPLPNGLPPGVVVSPDGRCCALTVTREHVTRLHIRCQHAAAAGSPFCHVYHQRDDQRTSGTVWCHKPTCPTCWKGRPPRLGADPHQQPSRWVCGAGRHGSFGGLRVYCVVERCVNPCLRPCAGHPFPSSAPRTHPLPR